MTNRPDRSEAAEYYFSYIDQVPAGEILDLLERQQMETVALLNTVTEQDSRYRYAPDKWSIRDVVNHLSDTERLFTFRAFWFARGFDSPQQARHRQRQYLHGAGAGLPGGGSRRPSLEDPAGALPEPLTGATR